MNRGQGVFYSSVEEAFRVYGRLSEAAIAADPDVGFIHDGPVHVRYAGARSDLPDAALHVGRDAVFSLESISERVLDDADLELRFWSSSGQLMTIIRSSIADRFFTLPEGKSIFRIKVRSIALSPGRYRLAAGFRRHGEVLGWSRDLAYVDIQPPIQAIPVCGAVYHDVIISGPGLA